MPQQVRKSLEEVRSLRKQAELSLEELAAAQAAALLAETPETSGRKIIVRTFSDRDLNFIKLLAQKLARLSSNAIALLATTSPQPSLVFAQSPSGQLSGQSPSGQSGPALDMGALLKETVAKLGGRGGGTKDMAQGGVAQADGIAAALAEVASRL